MKVVREILYEKFSEQSDPVKDMGIGVDEIVNELRKELEKEQGFRFGWGNEFMYYPDEGLVRITVDNLSEIGIVRLQKNLDSFFSKYPGVFKMTKKPKYKNTHTYRYGSTNNQDAVIRIMNK
jgi:hypothetical protein